MLERLSTIDWTKVHQAFGDGTHLPAAIRDLTSPDPQVREQAVMRIDNCAVVQGALTEAAAVVIPFLIEIMSEPDANGKSEVADLLFEFARGYPRMSSKSEVNTFWTAQNNLDLIKVAGLAEAEYRNARQALVQGIPVYCRALAATNPEVRLGAAYLLSVLPEAIDVAADPLLTACEVESDPDRRGVLLQCFGELFEGHDVGSEKLEQWMSNPVSEVDGTAAAVALVRVMGKKAPEAAVDILVRAMCIAWPKRPIGPTAALNVDFSLVALLALGIPRGIEACIRCLEKPRDNRDAHWVVKGMLDLLFGKSEYVVEKDELWPGNPKPRIRYRASSDSPLQRSILSDLECRALIAVFQCDKFWEIDSNLLNMFGFSSDRAELGRLLRSK